MKELLQILEYLKDFDSFEVLNHQPLHLEIRNGLQYLRFWFEFDNIRIQDERLLLGVKGVGIRRYNLVADMAFSGRDRVTECLDWLNNRSTIKAFGEESNLQ